MLLLKSVMCDNGYKVKNRHILIHEVNGLYLGYLVRPQDVKKDVLNNCYFTSITQGGETTYYTVDRYSLAKQYMTGFDTNSAVWVVTTKRHSKKAVCKDTCYWRGFRGLGSVCNHLRRSMRKAISFQI